MQKRDTFDFMHLFRFVRRYNSYIKLLSIVYILCLIVRIIEICWVLYFQEAPDFIGFELMGLFFDTGLSFMVFCIFFPIYSFLNKYNSKISYRVASFFVALLSVLHVLILRFFVYQLVPLNVSLLEYPKEEIFFTIQTSQVRFLPVLILSLLIISSVIYLSKKMGFITFKISGLLLALGLFSGMTFTARVLLKKEHQNIYSLNKSFFFYSSCINTMLFNSTNSATTASDIVNYRNFFKGHHYVTESFPFLHTADTSDVLGCFFNSSDTPPNIVILICEGLGDKFVHPYKDMMLMPFLDSLKNHSLYWNHFFTTSERSFNAVPSITGSLPYGKMGYTFLERMPYNFSLVNVLKRNGYYTTFFYGQGSWFHRKDVYFRYNNIDLIVDNSNFNPKYKRIIAGADNFFWGYHDKDLFNQSLEVMDTLSQTKRLDIYFTGSMHTPFVISDPDKYDSILEEKVSKIVNSQTASFVRKYQKYFRSVLFTNDALSDFFNKYKKRKSFNNTIFIITGDHPMTEIPIDNSLKRYHVPLIIYSPLLKKARQFGGTGSHLDIYSTVLSLLAKKYLIKIPVISSSLGQCIDTSLKYNPDYSLAIMNGNRDIIDFYHNGSFISNGKDFFSVGENYNLKASDDSAAFKKANRMFSLYKKMNTYACYSDKIIPDSLYFDFIADKVYQYSSSADTIHPSAEYFDLVKIPAIKNGDFYFDISFNVVKAEKVTPEGIFSIEDRNHKTLEYQNFGIPSDKKEVYYHFKIKHQVSTDSVLSFKAYFWNKEKIPVTLSKIKTAVYSIK